MRFKELQNKIKYNNPAYYYNNGKLKCVWSGMLEPMVFDAVLSDEYKKTIEKCGFTHLSKDYTNYKEIDDGIVSLSPIMKKLGDYEIAHGEIKKGNIYTYGSAFLYQGEVLDTDFSLVPYYYSGGCKYVDKMAGIYKDCLVYIGGDGIYMMNNTGQTGFVGPYPDMSESGKVNVSINNNELTVKEYVYYDNGHHHGGWEEETYHLDKVKEQLDEYCQKNEEEHEINL